MCKWIKDILFPTNVLGKKKKCIKVAIDNPPYTNRTFDIEWTGERLDICYTRIVRRGRTSTHNGQRLQFTNGNDTEESFIIGQRATTTLREWVDEVYFNCTNVTKLIVNGEQLI